MRKPPFDYAFQEDESVKEGFQRILAELSARARFLAINSSETMDGRIHEGRLLIKRLRALLWFARPAWGKRNGANFLKPLRRASALLAEQRDRAVFQKTLEHLIEIAVHDARDQAEVTRLGRKLASHSDDNSTAAQKSFRASMAMPHATITRIGKEAERGLDWPDPPVRAKKALRVTRDAGARALKSGRDADFHEWRKKAKRLLYLLELTNLNPTANASKLAQQVQKLQEGLGEYHDAVVVLEKVKKQCHGTAQRRLSHLLKERKTHLRKKARKLARKIKFGPG